MQMPEISRRTPATLTLLTGRALIRILFGEPNSFPTGTLHLLVDGRQAPTPQNSTRPGERGKLKGRIDGIKYDPAGFRGVWIPVQRGEAEPSEGRAIDHIGFRSTGPLAKAIDGLCAKGVTVTSEPRPLAMPGGPGVNFSYVAGPAGARIEIVERPGLKPGE